MSGIGREKRYALDAIRPNWVVPIVVAAVAILAYRRRSFRTETLEDGAPDRSEPPLEEEYPPTP